MAASHQRRLEAIEAPLKIFNYKLKSMDTSVRYRHVILSDRHVILSGILSFEQLFG